MENITGKEAPLLGTSPCYLMPGSWQENTPPTSTTITSPFWAIKVHCQAGCTSPSCSCHSCHLPQSSRVLLRLWAFGIYCSLFLEGFSICFAEPPPTVPQESAPTVSPLVAFPDSDASYASFPHYFPLYSGQASVSYSIENEFNKTSPAPHTFKLTFKYLYHKQ